MSHPFDHLSPDVVLDAVEQQGYRVDARILPLNSYENRVYQVGLEDAQPLIAKFYRPDRWSDEAILEEHAFAHALVEAEVSVVAPVQCGGESLFQHAGFRFALYPRCGGRAPEADNLDQLYRLGQLLGRLHAVGSTGTFQYRETLSVWRLGYDALKVLQTRGVLPNSLQAEYLKVARALLEQIRGIFEAFPAPSLRLHGDCHQGNILCRDDRLLLVDLDDCCTGPAVQDLWMLLSGTRDAQQAQLAELLEGYQEFFDFDPRQLHLIESLRTLRLLHYSAWLAQRWDDPAFPLHFPWFGQLPYWHEQLENLKTQAKALQEQPLRLFG